MSFKYFNEKLYFLAASLFLHFTFKEQGIEAFD